MASSRHGPRSIRAVGWFVGPFCVRLIRRLRPKHIRRASMRPALSGPAWAGGSKRVIVEGPRPAGEPPHRDRRWRRKDDQSAPPGAGAARLLPQGGPDRLECRPLAPEPPRRGRWTRGPDGATRNDRPAPICWTPGRISRPPRWEMVRPRSRDNPRAPPSTRTGGTRANAFRGWRPSRDVRRSVRS